jgi:hypothetical protein
VPPPRLVALRQGRDRLGACPPPPAWSEPASAPPPARRGVQGTPRAAAPDGWMELPEGEGLAGQTRQVFLSLSVANPGCWFCRRSWLVGTGSNYGWRSTSDDLTDHWAWLLRLAAGSSFTNGFINQAQDDPLGFLSSKHLHLVVLRQGRDWSGACPHHPLGQSLPAPSPPRGEGL